MYSESVVGSEKCINGVCSHNSLYCLFTNKNTQNKIEQRALSIDLVRDPGQKKLFQIFIVVFSRYWYVDLSSFIFQMEF